MSEITYCTIKKIHEEPSYAFLEDGNTISVLHTIPKVIAERKESEKGFAAKASFTRQIHLVGLNPSTLKLKVDSKDIWNREMRNKNYKEIKYTSEENRSYYEVNLPNDESLLIILKTVINKVRWTEKYTQDGEPVYIIDSQIETGSINLDKFELIDEEGNIID